MHQNLNSGFFLKGLPTTNMDFEEFLHSLCSFALCTYFTLYCSLQVTVSMCEIESNLDTWQIVIPHIVSFNFLIFCKGKLPTKWIKKTRRWDVFSNNMKIHCNQYIYINCTNKYPINHYYANVSLLYVTLSKEIICV